MKSEILKEKMKQEDDEVQEVPSHVFRNQEGGQGKPKEAKKSAALNHEVRETPKYNHITSDLPYMGQITLDSKPRRGRKPKKADICHLISKNYGINVSGKHDATPNATPNAQKKDAQDRELTLHKDEDSRQSTDSSLSPPPPPDFLPLAVKLEEPDYWDSDFTIDLEDEQNEPLNLCMRDLQGDSSSGSSMEQSLKHVRDGSNVWLMNQLGVFGSFPFNFRDPPPFAPSGLLYQALGGNTPGEQQPLPVASEPQLEAKESLPEPETGKKCKRCPIYIPPSVKAPTEVSICKFKFTGGAKPTLEKKKMLSVDAVGNFHFYSSTPQKHDPASQPSTSRARRRRSKKTVIREKLEQTFRDQGFLIQTQQFEAPQGATFCKFRQLKKFTRYLFRSWKDYLPGDLQEIDSPEPHQSTSPPPSPSNQ